MPTPSEPSVAPGNSNPVRASPDWPAAVIAGAYQTGVLGVRALRRRGVPATCFDCNAGFAGFTSVYGPARLCPNPDSDPAGWLAFMENLAGTVGGAGKPVLIPSADQFVAAIAEHADQLSARFILSPGIRLQGLFASKATQYELASKHGMPLPNTCRIQTQEAMEAFAREARFPCLLKPLHFREWQSFPDGHPLSFQKIAVAPNATQLVELWRLASQVNPDVIAQEIIEGPDTSKRVYFACYDRSGDRIAHALFRILRCDPLGFGPGTVTEPVIDADADRICDQWLRRAGYVGVCEIEVKRDSRDGQIKLIEANPRLTGGGDAAPYANVDVVWLHYLDLIGQTVAPVGPDGRDFRHIVVSSDLAAVINYRRAGLITWGEVLRSWRRPRAYYDLDPRDWRASIGTLNRMLRAGAKALLAPSRRTS